MYLVFDIGGTKTRLAVSKDRKTFYKKKIVATPLDFNQAILLFQKLISQLTNNKKVKAVAGGVAGPFDRKKTKLVNSPNLPDWINKPLKENLQKIIKAPVYLENDAALSGLGETKYGAGQGYKIIAYLTISTGVGGARIIKGKIDDNYFGFEPGHQIINFSAKNGSKTLEENIAGSALEERYNKKAHKIKKQEIWRKEADILATGLNNVIVLWSPEAIILGGSLMKSVSLDLVKDQLKKRLEIFPYLPEIKKAKLGDLAGLYGGLCFLNQK